MLAAGLAVVAHADEEPPLRNWFDDPYFQISTAIPDCPEPAGPFVDEAGRQRQSHGRAEKGTTCWLAGQCERPNAYAYDQDIAAAVRKAVMERDPFPRSTLWVTVQGRVVFVEGCAAPGIDARAVEHFMQSLPHVQQAIANIRTDPGAPPPYRTRRAR